MTLPDPVLLAKMMESLKIGFWEYSVFSNSGIFHFTKVAMNLLNLKDERITIQSLNENYLVNQSSELEIFINNISSKV